jgi:hypothetical protein
MDTNQYFVHYRDEDGFESTRFTTDAEARRWAAFHNVGGYRPPDKWVVKITRFIWNPDPVEVQVYPLNTNQK